MKTSQNIVSVLLLSMLLLVVLAAQASGSGNHELKRRVAPKQTYTALPNGVNADLIVFKLRDGVSRPQIIDTAFLGQGDVWTKLNQIIAPNRRTVALRPRISIDPVALDRMPLKFDAGPPQK